MSLFLHALPSKFLPKATRHGFYGAAVLEKPSGLSAPLAGHKGKGPKPGGEAYDWVKKPVNVLAILQPFNGHFPLWRQK